MQERVVLSTFSFHKEAMYRDLRDNFEQIVAHPIVGALAGDPSQLAVTGSDFDFDPVDEARLDEVVPPEQATTILDADASQRQCIASACQGRSFVMDGPPGTGKSQTIANMIAELIAAYLEFGCLSAARPGELDALRWPWVRFEDDEVDIREQWSAKVRKFTAPKYGPYTIALVARARELLLNMPRAQVDSQFVFLTNRGHHYTPSSRTHHWNRVRCSAGLPEMTLYLATRHYFGWYALNVLELEPHVIAEQLGHRDGGRLVVELYGHPDKARARRRIREAFDSAGKVRPLRIIKDESA